MKVQIQGIGFFGLLALIFITLKLLGYIGWSWWWVTVPLWGPAAATAATVFVIVGIMGAILLCVSVYQWIRAGK